MADALIVTLDAQFLQDGLPFLGLKLLLRPVDPAAAQSLGMGGQHQVGHDQAAVIEISATALIR